MIVWMNCGIILGEQMFVIRDEPIYSIPATYKQDKTTEALCKNIYDMLSLKRRRVSPEISVHNKSINPSIVNSSVSCLIHLYVNVLFQVPAVYCSVNGVKFVYSSVSSECH